MPEGPWKPLHILEPDAPQLWPWIATLGAILLLAWWMRRLWRRRTPARGPDPTPVVRPALKTSEDHPVEQLRMHFAETGELRQGCHALALGLRLHLSRSSDDPVTRWTAVEIQERVEHGAVAPIFEMLAELQFRRREPESYELINICNLARAQVGPRPHFSLAEVLAAETRSGRKDDPEP